MGKLKLHFMGTNGWFATETGNTASALIEIPEKYIVLDAGDGIRHLADIAAGRKKPVDIYLSHFHIDHVAGLHILSLFRKLQRISIYGQTGAKQKLSGLIAHPFTAPRQLRKVGNAYPI